MLSKNFELMNAIINFLSNKKVALKYYHEHHHNLYKLMEIFYLIGLHQMSLQQFLPLIIFMHLTLLLILEPKKLSLIL